MSDVLYVNLDALTTEYNKKIDAAIGRLEKLGDNAVGSTQRADKSASNWGSNLINMAKGFIAVDLASRVAGAVKQVFLLEESFKTALMPLQGITEKSGNFGKVLEFNKELADKYGQSIFVLAEEYKSLYATSSTAGMSLNATNSIYESLIKTGAGLKLSNDRISLSMRAITQMIDKQVVSSEELKGQLAEHIPGAYGLMAKAAQDAGISTTGTTQELAKLLEQGKVASTVVLPFFAKRMEEAFGKNAEQNVNTLSGSANRMRNELTYLMDALDNGKVLSFWATMQNGIADVFKDLTYMTKSGSFKDFMKYMTGQGATVTGMRIATEIQDKNFGAKSLKNQIAEFKKLQADFNLSKETNLFLINKGVQPNTSFVTQTAKTLKRYADIIKATAAETNGLIKQPITPPKTGSGVKTEKAKADTKNHGILSDMPDFIFKKINPSLKDPFQIWMEEKAKETKALLEKSTEVLSDKAKKLADRVVFNMAAGFENSEIITLAIKKLNIDTSDGLNSLEGDLINNFALDFAENMQNATQIINDSLSMSFGFIGETLSMSFAKIFNNKYNMKAGFNQLLGNFLQGLGEMITQMGQKMLIAAIAKDTAIKALTSFFGGAIPASIALIGIGSALKGGGMAMSANSNLGASTQRNTRGGASNGPGFGSNGLNITFNPVVLEAQGSALKGAIDVANYKFG
jgi:tape measure domain-containing protein